MLELLAWAVMAISIVGSLLNAQKRVSGFYFWTCSNLFWIGSNIHHGLYAQAGVFIFYTGICIYGLITWKKTDKKRDLL